MLALIWESGSDVANSIIGVISVLVLVGTLLVGPLVVAYRTHVKDQEEIATLQAQLVADPKKKWRVDSLKNFRTRLANCQDGFSYSQTDPLFLRALKETSRLDDEIQAFLDREMPEKLPTYLGRVQSFEAMTTMRTTGAEFAEFCRRRLSVLELIVVQIEKSAKEESPPRA